MANVKDHDKAGAEESTGQSASNGLFRITFHSAPIPGFTYFQEPHARLSTSHHVELTVHNGRHLVSLGSERDNP
jgi:hypothetical protein